MNDVSQGGTPANEDVLALFGAASAAQADRPFLVVAVETLLSYGAMLAETGRAAAWLRSVGVGPENRALVKAHNSPAAVIRALPSASVFMGTPTFYTRLPAEETP